VKSSILVRDILRDFYRDAGSHEPTLPPHKRHPPFSAGVICMGGGVFERQKKEEKEKEKEKFNKEL
jgi:hypothetical protein